MGIGDKLITIASMFSKLKDIVSIGREHLKTLHCIDLGANATIYDIMDSIAQIPPLQYATSISGLMIGATLPENTEYNLYLPKCTNYENAFLSTKNLKKITITGFNDSKLYSLKSCFVACKQLEEIDFGGGVISVKSITTMISNCTLLKKVNAKFDLFSLEDITVSLINIPKLEEIRFCDATIYVNLAIHTSPLLSDESIQSIIDGLDTVEIQKTLKLHSDVVEKLTDEQLKTIANKNWTVG